MHVHLIALLLSGLLLAQAGPTDTLVEGEGTKVPEPPKEKIDPDQAAADQAAQLFLQALLEGKADKLSRLGADPFSFSGKRIEGADAIQATWKKLLPTIKRELPEEDQGQMQVVDYAQAEQRFGKPPAKLDALKLSRCKFAIVQFQKRPGFVMIVQPRAKGEWVVVGLED